MKKPVRQSTANRKAVDIASDLDSDSDLEREDENYHDFESGKVPYAPNRSRGSFVINDDNNDDE